jgi:anti-sigma-K factor RskA
VVVLAELPDWLDVDFARSATAALAAIAVVVVLLAIFFARSLVVRVIVIVAMGAAIFGLLTYRDELGKCETNGGCPCTLFGEDLAGGSCIPTQ